MGLANECFLKACLRKPVEHTPIWIMRQAGRYLPEYRKIRKRNGILAICKNPDLCSKVTLLPIDILNVDAAILFADIMLPLGGLGVKFDYKEDVGPFVYNPIRDLAGAESLTYAKATESVPFVLDSIKSILDKLDERLPLIGFSGAPFTLAGYIIEGKPSREFTHTKKFMYNEPEAWNLLMQKLTKLVTEYLSAQIDAGVHAVQLFDSWAGYLSPRDYEEFVLPYSKQIFEHLKLENVPSIHFGTGTASLLELMKRAGGDVMGIDWRMQLDEAWKQIGYDMGIQGNLDPAAMLGTAEYMGKRAIEVLKQADNRPGHIFNLGHGILPETPLENAIQLVKTVHTYPKE